MIDMQWTFFANELLCFWSSRAFRQFVLRNIGQTLEIIVTGVTEMSRSKAKVNSHRTAETAFVLKIISSMLWAHLKFGMKYSF